MHRRSLRQEKAALTVVGKNCSKRVKHHKIKGARGCHENRAENLLERKAEQHINGLSEILDGFTDQEDDEKSEIDISDDEDEIEAEVQND